LCCPAFRGGAARVVRLAINGARQGKGQSSESDISVFGGPSIRESSEMGKHIDDAYSMLHPDPGMALRELSILDLMIDVQNHQ
jgi:hypothetical protein